jgi:hypothetical protein
MVIINRKNLKNSLSRARPEKLTREEAFEQNEAQF